MTRKQRKQKRHKEPKLSLSQNRKSQSKLDWLAKQIADCLMKQPRDRSNYGKVFTDEKGTGCYDYVGGKAYCKNCHYQAGCLKIEMVTYLKAA